MQATPDLQDFGDKCNEHRLPRNVAVNQNPEAAEAFYPREGVEARYDNLFAFVLFLLLHSTVARTAQKDSLIIEHELA
jgi:hypothetical protein